MARLTMAQAALLASLPCTCSETYPPAKKLVDLGLAKWVRGKFGDTLVPKDHPHE